MPQRQSRPPDLVVISPVNDWTCSACDATGDLLIMDEPGPLVEEGALASAEQQCLADEEARARRRERDAQRRADEDAELLKRLATEIARLFLGCPPARARAIAGHAGARGSGRVAAGRALDPGAAELAVIASVRHQDTRYDQLLMAGVDRADARDRLREDVDRVLESWRHV